MELPQTVQEPCALIDNPNLPAGPTRQASFASRYTTLPKPRDIVVIGAGIIGAMAARYLQKAGRHVTLIERNGVGQGASFGNAGILAFPEIIPLASPGAISKAPMWLADPLGPLSISPAYVPKLAPWLWDFWRASSRARFEQTVRVQADLMKLSELEMRSIAAEESLSAFFRNTGTLDLYDTKRSFSGSKPDWSKKRDAGHNFRFVGRQEIEELQPGLSARFAHGVFGEEGTQILDPYGFTKAIVKDAVSDGADVEIADARKVEPFREGARIVLTDGQSLEAQIVVIACGAWSRPLAKSLGDIVPLDTERGYNTTLPATAFPLQRQLYFNDHGFVVTPLLHGIRVGGAVEFAGLTREPNYARSQALLRKASAFLPTLRTEGGQEWMGLRPSMPDCLPVIDRSSATPSVVYAFGHGHLGLTQSAATARLVTKLIEGQPPSVLSFLSAKRFGKRR